MGLSTEHSCEAGSFSCGHNPHRFLQPEVLRLYFPALEPWIAWSVLLPSCSSLFIHTQMWDHQPPSCLPSPAPALPHVHSAPPISLGECFYFNSLVVGLPYSSICWQFWLCFVFKFVVFLFWLCEEAKCICLHLHLGRKSCLSILGSHPYSLLLI